LPSSQTSQNSRARSNGESFGPPQSSATTISSQVAPSSSQNQGWGELPSTQAVIEEETRATDLVVGSQDFDDGDYDSYELYGIF
jgi:hypothetical protein